MIISEDVAGSAWPPITVLQFVAGSPELSAAVFMDCARHASFVPNVLVSRQGEVRFEPSRGGTLFTYRNLVVPGGRIAGLGFSRRKAQRDVEATPSAIAARVVRSRSGDPALLDRQLRALRAVVSP